MKIYLVLLILAASIHSFSAHDVEGAFLKEGIVPEIVKAAPKQIVYVSLRISCSLFICQHFVRKIISALDFTFTDFISKWCRG